MWTTRAPTRRSLTVMFALVTVGLATSGCDFFRKRQCEWYLVPDLDNRQLSKEGYMSLCIRNYETGRQVCYFTAPIPLARSLMDKPVRFSDVKMDKRKFPKLIHSAEPCRG